MKAKLLKKQDIEKRNGDKKRESDLRKLCAFCNVSESHGEFLLREMRGLRRPINEIVKAKELGLI